MKKLAVVLALLMSTAVLAACSDSSSVGEGVKDIKDGTVGTRIGETTTTTEPPSTTTTTVKGATTTAKTNTTKPQSVSADIKVQLNDPYFVPKVQAVALGGLVRWTNNDTTPRSVVFDDNSYDSGPIPPGQHKDYVATRAGQFEYTDGTRPYAKGTLQVQAR